MIISTSPQLQQSLKYLKGSVHFILFQIPTVQIQNQLVSVDQFKNTPLNAIFLLTHFHTDHYMGLTNDHIIWCSELTRKLVLLRFSCKINVLQMNTPTQIAKNIVVTALPANHTFESVMFIVEEIPNKQCYLFTGDFKGLSQMHILQKIHFKKAYIDTTYLSLQVTLSQEASIKRIVEAVKSNIIPNRTKIICQTYSVGKEKYFIEIAKQLGIKFFANQPLRRATLKVYYQEPEYSQYFTDNDDNYGVVDFLFQRTREEELIQQYKNFQKIIIVYASGWQKSFHIEKVSSKVVKIKAPYSEHCSQSELYEFIKSLDCESLYSICCEADTQAMRKIKQKFTKKRSIQAEEERFKENSNSEQQNISQNMTSLENNNSSESNEKTEEQNEEQQMFGLSLSSNMSIDEFQ